MLYNIFISSPLEQFEVSPLFSMNAPVLGNFNLSLTNLGLYTFITMFLVLSLHFVGNNSFSLIPSKWSVALESAYASVHSIVRDQIGAANEIYTPFIYSLFFFILFANLNGNIPYGFTITTSVMVSIGMSVLIFLGVTTLGLSKHGVHFFAFFVPSGTPLALVPALVLIELISYLARAVSLGVRLFSNMVAGHTLMKILSTFLAQLFTTSILVAVVTLIPFAIFVALIGLEIAVSVIQAYVFCVLTSSYIKDRIELH
uniref:ATP synthase subunit a n=2 Tax=Agaricomycotina TaxID=5302 RepID=A0A2H4QBM1_9TREE|nr:ATP synthase F0 subunit a [Tremella fuciformis]YP_010180104.1 ATP synthase F0 subunit a [Auricularia auricula-judae]ATX61898.1 ATP synthase F0 subunit a [Tremella fuciformis]ATX61918.1 ATP synthase F0 subunit a [Tremella fuciformis]ATX61940.1 ATP synthase F0 subunit a [Tremella fuciformis]ATX61963.1 ATP synthase F0 subunit a [Tremella fuciformis]ATX61983.1 ATP synthase F0 subunit a [Tremella fuciformis]